MSHFLPLFLLSVRQSPSEISECISEIEYNLKYSKGGKTRSVPKRYIHIMCTSWKTRIGNFLHSSVVQVNCRSLCCESATFKRLTLQIFLIMYRTMLPFLGELSLLKVACVSKSEKICYLSFCFSGPEFKVI